jgi:ATP-binding cassette subfamily C protein
MSLYEFARRILGYFPGRVFAVLTVLLVGSFVEGTGLVLLVPVVELAMPSDHPPSAIQASVTQGLEAVGLEFTLEVGLLAFFVVFLVQLVLFYVREYQLAKNQVHVKLWFRDRMCRAFFASDWAFFLRQQKGNLVSSVVTECEKAGLAFNQYLTLVSNAVLIVVYSSVAMFMSWHFTLGILVVGALLTFVLRGQIRSGRAMGASSTELNARFQSVLGESLDSAKLIKASSLEDKAVDLLREEATSLAELEKSVRVKTALIRLVGEPLVVAVLCVSVYLAIVVLQLRMPVLLALIYIFFRLFPLIMSAQRNYFQTLVFIPSFDRVESLIAQARASRERGVSGGIKFERLVDRLEIQAVTYTYERGPRVLDNVSFEIEKGGTVGMTGTSGAGKSTLGDVILGLLTPETGRLVVDGVPLAEYDMRTWRRRIGYVSQETILLHDTVRANILWGVDRQVDQRELEKLAHMAHAHHFIQALADGYETVIGDRGVRLSGGQRQRLALARALARNPELLILDEATSALDSESERKVQEAIESLASSVTVLVIAHRLATLASADRIHFLDAGKIVEAGTFTQLVQAGGKFAQLYGLQAHGDDQRADASATDRAEGATDERPSAGRAYASFGPGKESDPGDRTSRS